MPFLSLEITLLAVSVLAKQDGVDCGVNERPSVLARTAGLQPLVPLAHRTASIALLVAVLQEDKENSVI